MASCDVLMNVPLWHTTMMDAEIREGGPEFGSQLRAAIGRPLTAEELESWILASPAQRQRALVRMRIIDRWIDALTTGAPFDRAAAASDLGVGSAASGRNLVSAWRKSPRLATLGIRTGQRPRPEAKASERRVARAVADRIIRKLREEAIDAEGPVQQTDEWIVRKALQDPVVSAAPLSLKLMRRVVGDARRAAEPKEFGREIAIDDIPLSVCSLAGRAYHCVMVLDRSGLVLGFMLIDRQPDLPSTLEALRRAADALDDWRLPGFSAAEDRPSVTIPAGAPDDAMNVLRLLARNPGWHVAEPAVRGRAAVKIVGEGLGRVAFRPSLLIDSGRQQCEAGIPLVTLEEAEALVRLLVARHNATIVLQSGDEDPAVAARRAEVAELIRSVTRG